MIMSNAATVAIYGRAGSASVWWLHTSPPSVAATTKVMSLDSPVRTIQTILSQPLVSDTHPTHPSHGCVELHVIQSSIEKHLYRDHTEIGISRLCQPPHDLSITHPSSFVSRTRWQGGYIQELRLSMSRSRRPPRRAWKTLPRVWRYQT